MVQKHIIVSMIASVAIAGILIMATLANQAYSRQVSSSVECKITKGGPQECVSETAHERSNNPQAASNGNAGQAASSSSGGSSSGGSSIVKCKITKNEGTAITTTKCKTKTTQGPSNTGNKPTSASGATTQLSSSTGNIAQEASNNGAKRTSAAGATTQESGNAATEINKQSRVGNNMLVHNTPTLSSQESSNAGKAATSNVECKTAPNGSQECVSKPKSTNILVHNTPTLSQERSNAVKAAQGAHTTNNYHVTNNYHPGDYSNNYHPGKYHWGPWGHGEFRWQGNLWHNKRCFFGPYGQVRCMYR